MDTKKISFGFMKTRKQDKPKIAEEKEYIECVEEKSIKVVGGEIIREKAPLVIAMKPNTLITTERLKQIAEKVENFEYEQKNTETTQIKKEISESETLEQMAERELIEEAKKVELIDAPKLVVPIPSLPVIDGQPESTMDDYESVPIEDFGLAMLRGMGWLPGKELSKYKHPQLRPKGLGLGADKLVKDNQKKSSKENEEGLVIVKEAFVKITMGKYAGFFGQVVSLDEENGRAMVNIPIKKETVRVSEFMLQPVSNSEYNRQSKVINVDSYEEYKRKDNNPITRSKQEKDSEQRYSSDKKNDIKKESSNRSSSNNKYQEEKKDRYKDHRENNTSRKYSNKESLSSDSDRSHRRQSHSKDIYQLQKTSKYAVRDKDNRNQLKHGSNESLNSSNSNFSRRSSSSREPRRHKKSSKASKEKKDIDKKRKGKKKKRDRDRSPYYKKCRK